MSPETFRKTLAALDITQSRLARILGGDRVTTNRWAHGRRPIPRYVELLFAAWMEHPDLIPED